MLKQKQIALIQGIVSTVLFVLFLAVGVFILTYDRVAITAAAERLNNQQTEGQVNLSGLGPAFLYVFILVAMVALSPSAIIMLVCLIGQFAVGTKKSKGSLVFTIVGMVGNAWAVFPLGFMAFLIGDATLYDVFALIVHWLVALLALVGFIWGIVSIVLQKKAKKLNINIVVENCENVTDVTVAVSGQNTQVEKSVKTAEEIAPAAEYPNEE